MHVQASSLKAWLDVSRAVPTIPDQRCDGRVTLHFYAMVSALGGAVALKYVTGTSDHKGHQQYKVCTHTSESFTCAVSDLASSWNLHGMLASADSGATV